MGPGNEGRRDAGRRNEGRGGTSDASGAGTAAGPTVDAAEIEKFSRIAAEWWDPKGKFRPLHKLNPLRIGYARDRLCADLGRDPRERRPLAGVRLLDVGCGGGLISEPMARLGAEVVGIDAAERNIAAAATHAREQGLLIDYRCATAESLAAAGEGFDAVLALEIVEHVADVAVFLHACAALTRPGGTLILSTLNRTLRSFALAIVGAEYVLRWLPRGTHDWRKFLTPVELESALVGAGMEIAERVGVAYAPLNDRWSLSRDDAVNYMVRARRR